MTIMEMAIARVYAQLLEQSRTRELTPDEQRRLTFLESIVSGYQAREIAQDEPKTTNR